jgi:hypothetical protein
MKGMIFSGPMVRAINEGRKLVTRRPIKCIHKIVSLGTPAEWNAGKVHPNMRDYEEWGPKDAYHLFKSDYGSIFAMPGPYRPGEVVYVKETCYICRSADDGAALCDPPVVYAANGATKSDDYPFVRSAMVMPERASRFHLRIEGVRPERAGAMTADDALLEGCEDYYWGGYDFAYQEMPASVSNFVRLWDSIYSKTFPWDSNPFVWRIAFSVERRER